MNNNDSMQINYNIIPFHFDYTWIRDKEIVHRGNEYGGALIIMDKDGRLVKMWGYELVNQYKDQDPLL